MKVWGIIIALAMMLMGLTKGISAYKNPHPTRMDFRDVGIMLFQKETPPDWLELTKCSLDLLNGVFFSSKLSNKNTTDEIYVPIKTASGVDADMHVAFLIISDEASIAAYNQLSEMEDDDTRLYEFMQENKSVFFRDSVTVTGLVVSNLDMDDDKRKKLMNAFDVEVFPKFLVIEEGAEPSKSSIIFFPLGLALLIYCVYGLIKQRKKRKQSSSTTTS